MSNEHRDCYGAMFPDTLHHEYNKTKRGVVFGYRVDTAGGTHLVNGRQVSIDVDAWDHCRRCAEFVDCRELSRARLELETAIAAST
jgi:hypothetical protein